MADHTQPEIRTIAADLTLLPEVSPFPAGFLTRLGLRGFHCGSGLTLHPGWLNADFMHLHGQSGGTTQLGRIARIGPDRYYLEHNLTRPVPLADGCMEWAFAEHFIEHIRLEEAVNWFKDMRRILKPGGVLRVSTPDLRKYLRAYTDPATGFFEEHRRRLLAMGMKTVPTRPAWMVNQIFRYWGHQWLYDIDEIRLAATSAGFSPTAIVECSYRQGRVNEIASLDMAVRNDESLYAELIRE